MDRCGCIQGSLSVSYWVNCVCIATISFVEIAIAMIRIKWPCMRTCDRVEFSLRCAAQCCCRAGGRIFEIAGAPFTWLHLSQDWGPCVGSFMLCPLSGTERHLRRWSTVVSQIPEAEERCRQVQRAVCITSPLSFISLALGVSTALLL